MLLQTNSYIVPRDKRVEHARLLRRFRQTLLRLGADHFEVYEQVGANWNTGETTGRFVQIMRFRDRKHQLSVQAAERSDQQAQALVQEFCELINFPYQQQQGLFAVGFYTSFLRMPPQRTTTAAEPSDTGVEIAGHAEEDQDRDSDRAGVLSMPGVVTQEGVGPADQNGDADTSIDDLEPEQPAEVDLNAEAMTPLDDPEALDQFIDQPSVESSPKVTEDNKVEASLEVGDDNSVETSPEVADDNSVEVLPEENRAEAEERPTASNS